MKEKRPANSMTTVKSWFRRIGVWNLLILGLLAFMLWQRAPQWLSMFKAQGSPAPIGVANSLTGERISIPLSRNHVVVFWATWCGPCSVELARINKLIEVGKIAPSEVLAVSVMEDPGLVEKFAKERNYLFQVAIDATGELAQKYNVSGTPTIAFIDSSGLIQWLSVGLSPTLELRVLSFLSQQ